MKRERLDWLADNPLYTRRFAFYVGRRCRESTVQAIAEELHLDWHTVKELDKQYMREQLRRAGCPAPRVIGVDEIAVGRRHSYRIVVSDLERGRPIWFGGKDRSEASLDEFFAWFAEEPRPGFSKATVSAWRVALEARGLGSVSINVRITAVRKLAVEAADNGLLAPELAAGITRVKGGKSIGVRVGNWLSIQQAQKLLNAPDISTKKGLRDRAMLASCSAAGSAATPSA